MAEDDAPKSCFACGSEELSEDFLPDGFYVAEVTVSCAECGTVLGWWHRGVWDRAYVEELKIKASLAWKLAILYAKLMRRIKCLTSRI